MNDEQEIEDVADESKDWISNHWSQLTALVIVVVAFVTVQSNTISNSKDIDSIKNDIEPINGLIVKVNDALNKNSATCMNLERFKKDTKEDRVALLNKLEKFTSLQIKTLTIVESFGNIYPTKDHMREIISKSEEKLEVKIDKKVGYDRVDVRTLKN